MGRKNLFDPRTTATTDDWARGERLLSRFTRNDGTSTRVIGEFIGFVEHNNFKSISRALEAYIGVRRRPGKLTSIGTLRNYVRFVHRFARAEKVFADKADALSTWRIVNALEIAYAVSGSKKAPPVLHDDVISYIRCALIENSLLGRAIAMISFTGCRNIDLTRLPVRQIWIEAREAQVEYRWTKNRRKIGKRFIWRLKMAHKVFGIDFPECIRSHDTNDESLPWAALTTNILNAQLKIIATTYDLPPVTSYSFRNYFMQQVFVYCKWEWPRVIEITGHLDVETVKAHYDRIRPPQPSDVGEMSRVD